LPRQRKSTRDGGVLLSLVQDREYLEAELAKDLMPSQALPLTI
jgi:hypothetical protein